MTKQRNRTNDQRTIDGRYRLGDRRIERDDYAIYDGEQLKPARPVTIKLSTRSAKQAAAVRSRLEEEAALRVLVDDPRFAEVLALGTHPVGRPYAVWCRPAGRPLTATGPVAPEIAAQLRAALATLHSRQIKVGALDPSQIWTTETGRVVIADLPNAVRCETLSAAEIAEDQAALETLIGPAESAQSRPERKPAAVWRTTKTWALRPLFVKPTRPVVYGLLGLLLLALSVSLTPSDEVPATQPIAAAPEAEETIDPSIVASLHKARTLVEQGRSPYATRPYGRVAHKNPELLEDRDLHALADMLSVPTRRTSEAEWSLLRVGDRALPALELVFKNRRRSSYHRRRAGEVMKRLGASVDLVPFWIAALESKRCETRRLAVQRLRVANDPRSRAPLERLADKDGWFTSYCGAEEAEEALEAVVQAQAKKSARRRS